MILKGGTRSDAIDLALHLSNEVDNERVVVHDLRGSIAPDLYGAFREWQIQSEATKCAKPFYSLSINPDPHQRDWTDKEWDVAIAKIEDRLNLKDQPRAIIFHEKIGDSDGRLRKHCHVVWSRITPDLKSIHMSKDYYILKDVARELAKEFKLQLRYDHTQDKGTSNAQSYDHAKSQGLNRDPETTKERKASITKLWHTHSNPKAFETALKQKGYILAKGDKRGFVIVDKDNQIHSLARQIDGIKTRQIKDRLGSPNHYSTLDQAKEEWRIRKSNEKTVTTIKKRVDLTLEQKRYAKLRSMAQRLDKVHYHRRNTFRQSIRSMKHKHRDERENLIRKQRAKDAKILKTRHNKRPQNPLYKGIRKTFGIDLFLSWKHAHEDRRRQQQYVKEQDILKDLHIADKERLRRKALRLKQQQKREIHSVKKAARKLGQSKEQLQKLIDQQRQKQKQQELQKQKSRTRGMSLA